MNTYETLTQIINERSEKANTVYERNTERMMIIRSREYAKVKLREFRKRKEMLAK